MDGLSPGLIQRLSFFSEISAFVSFILLLLLFSCSVMSDSLWPHSRSMSGFPVLHHFLELAQTHVHWVGDAIQPFHPLSSPPPPALSLFQHQSLFQWVSSSHQVSKELELQLQDQTFKWIWRLISFRNDWLDLLEVQRTFKSLLQYRRSKASVLQRSAFFLVQLSHPYMTTRKTIALNKWTFVSKVMSLLFNI